MRRLPVLLLIAVLVAALAAPAAAEKAESTELPFKGTFSGHLLGFDEDPGHIAERCLATPPGKVAWAVTSFEGWGTATHMGSSYVYAEHCSYAGLEGPDGTYGEGVLTMEAANGDTLIGTYTNGVSLSGPPIIGFMDYFTFTDGGSGRFSFATGGGVEIGAVDMADGSFFVEMEGFISHSRR